MCTAHCRLHNEYFILYNAHCMCIMPYRDCTFENAHCLLQAACCKLLAASWYSHPSLNSDVFETRLYCNWQFKGHLQSIRHLSENARPLIWILLKVNQNNTSPSNPFQSQRIFACILPLLEEHPRQSKLSIWNERCSNLNHHWYTDTAVPR